MEKIELYNNILSDIGNFSLVIFGFSVTLFTVLYSFILTKREKIIEYSDKIKNGSQDILTHQRHKNAILFVKKFKTFNTLLIWSIWIDLIIYIICILTKYFIDDVILKRKFLTVIGIVFGAMFFYVIIMLSLTIKDYIKVTKLK